MEKQGTYSHQYKGHIFRKLGSVCITAEGGGANLKNKRLRGPWTYSCHSVSVGSVRLGKHLLTPFHLRSLLPFFAI